MIGFELPSAPVVFRGRTAALGLVAGRGRHRGRRHHPRPPGHQGLAHGRHRGPHRARSRRRSAAGWAPGASVTLLGLASLFIGLFGRVQTPLLAIGLGSAGVLVGIAMLTPLVARPAARLLGLPLVRIFGQPAVLGRENAMRNPRRTSATAAALMIGITLVGVVAILAASIKSSASHTIQDTLRADFVVTPRTVGRRPGRRPAAVGDKLRKVEGGGHGVGDPVRPVGPRGADQDAGRGRPQDGHRRVRARPGRQRRRPPARRRRACWCGRAWPSATGGRWATRCR